MRRFATSLSLVNFLSRAILILHRLLCSDGEQPLCISFLMGFLNEAVAKETLQELGRPWSDCIPSSSVSLSSKSEGRRLGKREVEDRAEVSTDQRSQWLPGAAERNSWLLQGFLTGEGKRERAERFLI